MSSTQQVKKKIGLNTVISWGASVVIIGLMFKILHWQGGEYMIAIGLLTESFLFFILGIASMSVEEEDKTPDGTPKGQGLDALLNTAITPKVIEGLTAGFQQFTRTVASVNQIAGSTNVTGNFLKEVEVATGDVKKFRDGMVAVSTGFDNLNKTMQAMSQISSTSQAMLKDMETASAGLRSYAKNITDMNASFDQFNKTLQAVNQMTASSQTMMKEFEAATLGMRAYNKNLSDLSRIYQAQLEAFRKN